MFVYTVEECTILVESDITRSPDYYATSVFQEQSWRQIIRHNKTIANIQWENWNITKDDVT
ncbi:hypothetical protein J6590_024191 [Homalodisca vitripennis]|nr:hypothetical protein J6590_024191 [Homalodisca vitripennis]